MDTDIIDIKDIPVYFIASPKKNTEGNYTILRSKGFKNIIKVPGVSGGKKVTNVAQAHVKALEKALSECSGPFIILEDDVRIFSAKHKFVFPENTDAVYLGLSTWGLKNGKGHVSAISAEPVSPTLYRLYNMLTAHAILYINHDYARFLATRIPIFINMETNQDKMRAETLKYWNVYAVETPVFYQSGRYEQHTRFQLSKKALVPIAEFYK